MDVLLCARCILSEDPDVLVEDSDRDWVLSIAIISALVAFDGS